MATKTPNYELWMPDGTDDFDEFREEFNENMQTIDEHMGGGGGSSSLAGLSDVNLSSPSNNQVLKYNSTSQKWENQNESGGGSGGHTIYDSNGTAMTQRSGLQFTGNASVTDDSTNDTTIVNISGSGGGGIIPMLAGAEQLWSGSFSGTGTIDVPNLDKYLVIAVQNDVSVLVLGNTFTGSGALGIYGQAQIGEFSYRFDNSVANKLKIDVNNRGIIYYNGSSTAYGGSWCTITKIYGLVRKEGNKAISAPIIYSDTERKVGVWRDNKPIYQKTITYHDSTGQYSELIIDDISSLDIDTFVNAFGSAYEAGWGWGSIPSDGNFIRYNTTNGNLQLDTSHFSWSNADYYITVQYTKTTDVAGSGDWTTEVPTVHYTTSEQVVGTWLGKPLYQQTIPFSGLNFTGNVDYPFDVSSYAVNAERIFLLLDMSFYIVSNVQRSFIYSTSSPVQSTYVMLRTEVNRNNASGYVTIRYTKTTD